MPDLTARYAHVPARIVRFWAWVDSSVTWTLALPTMAPVFLQTLYRIEPWLGGSQTMPALLPVHVFFVSLSGVLISLWVLARLLHPAGVMALFDGWGRVAVAVLLVWMLAIGGPRFLALFIVTEMAGAIAQLRWAYRKPVTGGARLD